MGKRVKGQASVEALACAAALLAFILVLAGSASGFASLAQEKSRLLSDGVKADMLALRINLRALGGRLSAFQEVGLDGCALAVDGVACNESFARTLVENSGGGRFGFSEALPV